MAVLGELAEALRSGSVEVIDLTAPLVETTPILLLPEPFANTSRFRLEELSRYDERGPGWYWNDIHTGEHTGTHLDAPVHWITGRDKGDVAQIAPGRLVAPAAVLDRAGADPDYLLQIDDVKAWQAEHGPLPATRTASSTPTRPARTRRASRSSARGGWPRRPPSSASESRRSAPTQAPPTRSTHRSRATRSCSAPASTG